MYPAELGTHLHHVGFWVDALRDAVEDARRAGWQLEVTVLDDDGRPSSFAYLSRPGETWIELVDAANRDWLIDLLESRP